MRFVKPGSVDGLDSGKVISCIGAAGTPVVEVAVPRDRSARPYIVGERVLRLAPSVFSSSVGRIAISICLFTTMRTRQFPSGRNYWRTMESDKSIGTCKGRAGAGEEGRPDDQAALGRSCISSFRMASVHAEDLSERPLFDQHAPERLHQRTNPIFGPVGKMVAQHQPLPKQRMRPPLHRARLQPTVIPDALASRTQQRQHGNRQRADQQQAAPPVRPRDMHRRL